jgi:small-conductance mechanosensitive channel
MKLHTLNWRQVAPAGLFHAPCPAVQRDVATLQKDLTDSKAINKELQDRLSRAVQQVRMEQKQQAAIRQARNRNFKFLCGAHAEKATQTTHFANDAGEEPQSGITSVAERAKVC